MFSALVAQQTETQQSSTHHLRSFIHSLSLFLSFSAHNILPMNRAKEAVKVLRKKLSGKPPMGVIVRCLDVSRSAPISMENVFSSSTTTSSTSATLLMSLFQSFSSKKLLEACVKNCNHRFHVQIATKDFMDNLVRLIDVVKYILFLGAGGHKRRERGGGTSSCTS